jgi:hypothetical protein
MYIKEDLIIPHVRPLLRPWAQRFKANVTFLHQHYTFCSFALAASDAHVFRPMLTPLDALRRRLYRQQVPRQFGPDVQL